MVLNNLSQNFAIYLMPNTFYAEVNKLWRPQMKRMFLPYVTLEDFFNAQIASISFPSVTVTNVQQKGQNYQLTKRAGIQLDQAMNKLFTLNVKLSESYMSYFIARQQFDLFLKYGENAKELYMPPISITILDDGGFETVTYTYNELTPFTISDFDLSYAAKPGSFTTFAWEFNFNYFDIWYRDTSGRRVKSGTDPLQGILTDKGMIDTSQFGDDYDLISKQKSMQNKRNIQVFNGELARNGNISYSKVFKPVDRSNSKLSNQLKK